MGAQYKIVATFELDRTADNLAEQLRDEFYNTIAQWANPEQYQGALVRVYETREVS